MQESQNIRQYKNKWRQGIRDCLAMVGAIMSFYLGFNMIVVSSKMEWVPFGVTLIILLLIYGFAWCINYLNRPKWQNW